jgi:nucleotide-binding universal stress UspA family protein
MDKLQQEAKKITDSQSGIEIIFDTVSVRGIPYEEILKEQEAKGIDLIVIASKCFDPMKNVMVSVECSCMY